MAGAAYYVDDGATNVRRCDKKLVSESMSTPVLPHRALTAASGNDQSLWRKPEGRDQSPWRKPGVRTRAPVINISRYAREGRDTDHWGL